MFLNDWQLSVYVLHMQEFRGWSQVWHSVPIFSLCSCAVDFKTALRAEKQEADKYISEWRCLWTGTKAYLSIEETVENSYNKALRKRTETTDKRETSWGKNYTSFKKYLHSHYWRVEIWTKRVWLWAWINYKIIQSFLLKDKLQHGVFLQLWRNRVISKLHASNIYYKTMYFPLKVCLVAEIQSPTPYFFFTQN